jgi:dolichyl-phosphate beta-glucosyltransferase
VTGSVDLSIVIPAFNEELRLPRTLSPLVEWLRQRGGSFEVVVVDDGSTDGTRELCEREFAEVRELRLLGGPPNRGKGHAVRTGMLAARGAVRVMCDADGSMPPRELGKLLAPIAEGRADIAIGSRYVGGRVPHGQPRWRTAWSRLANRIVRRSLAPGVFDIHCGYKAFTADAARDLFSRARIDGWTFDLEVLALAQRLRRPMVEVGISWHESGRSRVRPLRDLARVLQETLELKRNLASDVYRLSNSAP